MKRQLTRYNVVSETADGFGFAARLAAEGEAVRFWARSGAVKSVGDGFPGGRVDQINIAGGSPNNSGQWLVGKVGSSFSGYGPGSVS